MFDFEKLEVYQVTKSQNIEVIKFLLTNDSISQDIADQWKKTSLETVVNLAESTARMTHQEKKQFLTMARGNINTCVALMELGKELKWIEPTVYDQFYARYEQMSKMMLGMIRSFSNENK